MGWIVIDPKAVLGTFSDNSAGSQHLILVSGATPGSVEWAIAGELPKGFAPFLFSRETYDVMHNGTLGENGIINHKGTAYRVTLWFDGLRFVAEAVTC